jgi:hypothetical protein
MSDITLEQLNLEILVDMIAGQINDSNKPLLIKSDIELLERFKSFNLSTDWMDAKHTRRLLKIFENNLDKIIDINLPKGKKLNSIDLIYYTSDYLCEDSTFAPMISAICDKWIKIRLNRLTSNKK